MSSSTIIRRSCSGSQWRTRGRRGRSGRRPAHVHVSLLRRSDRPRGVTMEAAAPPGSPAGATDYPVRLDVEYPEGLSRWKIFVKWLLAIPHFIIVYILQIVNSVLVFIAFFAILFTKKWPRGMFDFSLQIHRWTANVLAYSFLLLRDEYPPFSGDV